MTSIDGSSNSEADLGLTSSDEGSRGHEVLNKAR